MRSNEMKWDWTRKENKSDAKTEKPFHEVWISSDRISNNYALPWTYTCATSPPRWSLNFIGSLPPSFNNFSTKIPAMLYNRTLLNANYQNKRYLKLLIPQPHILSACIRSQLQFWDIHHECEPRAINDNKNNNITFWSHCYEQMIQAPLM